MTAHFPPPGHRPPPGGPGGHPPGRPGNPPPGPGNAQHNANHQRAMNEAKNDGNSNLKAGMKVAIGGVTDALGIDKGNKASTLSDTLDRLTNIADGKESVTPQLASRINAIKDACTQDFGFTSTNNKSEDLKTIVNLLSTYAW